MNNTTIKVAASISILIGLGVVLLCLGQLTFDSANMTVYTFLNFIIGGLTALFGVMTLSVAVNS